MTINFRIYLKRYLFKSVKTKIEVEKAYKGCFDRNKNETDIMVIQGCSTDDIVS